MNALVGLHSTGSLESEAAAARQLIDAFLSGRNPRTIEAYKLDLEDFRSFLGVETLAVAALRLMGDGNGAANRLVLEYRTQLLERELQPTTINRRLAALRSLVKLGRTLGLISWTIDIANLKSEVYRDTKGPGRGAIQEMLSSLETSDRAKDVRDYALLRLLYDLALRASEVCSLDVADIDLQASTVTILGKGNSQKTRLSLAAITNKAVSAWLQIRDPSIDPLFYNFDRARKGCRLTRNGLYQLVRSLGARAGVKVRPHGIRHSAITQAIRAAQINGITLPEVRQFSRHASLATLQIYADKERDVQGTLSDLVAHSVSSGVGKGEV